MVNIAISGPDNVGKTTQIRLLTDRTAATNAGALDDHDPRWKAAKGQGLAAWWFDAAPIEEVIDVLACSYLHRSATYANEAGLVLIDRGMTMLEASVVATIATREHLDHPSAVDRATVLLAPYAADIKQARSAEQEMLLLHDRDAIEGAARALRREAAVTPEYIHFQHILNTHLHGSAAAAGAIVTGDTSIMDVHRELCIRLNQVGANIKIPSLPQTRIVALGGLSESGKSTAGAYLHDTHHYDRLKIGYLLDGAAARHDIDDIYSLDPMRIAELFVGELDRYATAHHYQRWISIESLHSLDLAASLRVLLGEQLTVVYLDVSEQQRQARGTAGPGDVTDRDVTKRSRGADRIRDIADVVIDNSGTCIELHHRLDRLVRGQRWAAQQPRVTTVRDLNLPSHLSRYLDRLLHLVADPDDPLISLLAVTGSGSRGKYQQGWSDLDILVIAEPGELPAIRAALAALVAISREMQTIKVGVSVVTLAECRAGALTSRLLHTIGLIASGATPVLWCAPGVTIPRPDDATVMSASWRDANLAAIEIRRMLIREHPDLRALYKVTALLAKIVMIGERQYHPDDRAALTAFLALTGQPTDVLDAARTSPEAGTALAGHVVSWWLSSVGGAR